MMRKVTKQELYEMGGHIIISPNTFRAPKRTNLQRGSLIERRKADEERRKNKFIGKLIEAREALGLSQRDVAAILGCSQSIVSRVERGAEVSFQLMEKWAALLQLPLSNFETLNPDDRKRSFFSPNEPYFEGHSLTDWKIRVREHKNAYWKVPKGAARFSHLLYHRTKEPRTDSFSHVLYRWLVHELQLPAGTTGKERAEAALQKYFTPFTGRDGI